MNILGKLANDTDLSYRSQTLVQALDLYSAQSIIELTEELSSIYSNEEISSIYKSLTAFRKKFTRSEYISNLKNLNERKLIQNIDSVLNNLYRVGILGCINEDGIEMWYYRNRITPIEGKGWMYLVHRGLWNELQLQSTIHDGIPVIEIQGKPILCKITKMYRRYFFLQFEWGGKKKRGKIHFKNVNGRYIKDPSTYIEKEMPFYVVDYDSQNHSWEFSYDIYRGYLM